MNVIQFEEELARMRLSLYRHPKVDIVGEGFRPVSGKVADFSVVQHEGRYHFFYIERRIVEGTPFYPGNEVYFGHASTRNFLDWEVHDPVMFVRPGTWEGAHVWAPFVLPYRGRFVMAYTGVNRHISQDIGLAFSDDLFEWERWERNPISPCKGRPWSFWRDDGICSCRDPHLLIHDGRVWMAYTANTKDGASCIALASTADLEHWEDHGPILVGPAEGYEPRLEGGHPQGSLESCNLLRKREHWLLLVKAKVRATPVINWVFESDRIDEFDFSSGGEFWPGALGVEVVKERGSRSLLACFTGGTIRFGEAEWSGDKPTADFVRSADRLATWGR
jgi:hypothetical protein